MYVLAFSSALWIPAVCLLGGLKLRFGKRGAIVPLAALVLIVGLGIYYMRPTWRPLGICLLVPAAQVFVLRSVAGAFAILSGRELDAVAIAVVRKDRAIDSMVNRIVLAWTVFVSALVVKAMLL